LCIKTDRGITLVWFKDITELTNYINNGKNRTIDPITAFIVFAHGTDVVNGTATGDYAITFGLYTDKDAQLRWYTSDIGAIERSSFADNNVSVFHSCRTGNDFANGNFAQSWANRTGGTTLAYAGGNGRSVYSDILGTVAERHGAGSSKFKAWKKNRGAVNEKPGEAWRLPKAAWNSSLKGFLPAQGKEIQSRP